MKTRGVRDAAGRVLQEIASDGARDRTEYDAAGLVIRYTPRPISGDETQVLGSIRCGTTPWAGWWSASSPR